MKTYKRYSNPKNLTEFEYLIDLDNGAGILEYCYEGWIERGGDKTTPFIISGNNCIDIIDNKPVFNLDKYKTQTKENIYSLGHGRISTLIPSMDLEMMKVVNPDAITTFLLPKALRLKYWNFLSAVKTEYVRLAQGITAATTNDEVDTIVASENYPTAIVG